MYTSYVPWRILRNLRATTGGEPPNRVFALHLQLKHTWPVLRAKMPPNPIVWSVTQSGICPCFVVNEVVMFAALMVPMIFVWGAGVTGLWVVRLQHAGGKRVSVAVFVWLGFRGSCGSPRGTSWEVWRWDSLRAPS